MKILALLLVTYLWFHPSICEHAITYEKIDTRFGDQVLNYLHAKWISYCYNIPLYYHPFPYSEALMLHEKEPVLEPSIEASHRKMLLRHFSQPNAVSQSTLFVSPYFAETKYEWQDSEFYFAVDWKNEEFRKIALELIAPQKPLELDLPPSDQVSIALHIREGGGFDSARLPINYPIKSPPLIFYIESLLDVMKYFPKMPIYCRIFTDAKKPKDIVGLIARIMPRSAKITFGYRKEHNGHDINVLEDFFSLFQYDVLIRPGSNFSIVPSLLHDYAVLYYPISFKIKDDIVSIEECKIEIHKELYEKCLKRVQNCSDG